MLDRLQNLIGEHVVVDYRANNEMIVYAKGILDIDVEGNKLIVTGEKLWFIDPKSIVNLRVGGGGEE